MRFALIVGTTLAVLPTQLRAQDFKSGDDVLGVHRPSADSIARRTDVGHKDPGTAELLGVLLPGGGQLYAGRTGTGLGLLGLSAAAVVTGAALSKDSKCSSLFDQSGNTFNMTCTKANHGPLADGEGVAFASWLYGIVTAAGDVRDANAVVHHARATPVLERTHGRTAFGLSYGI
jgi:hypothetical protein